MPYSQSAANPWVIPSELMVATPDLSVSTIPVDELPVGARLRIAITYGWRHRRLAALDTPRRFTEMVQRRKLFDRSASQAALLDKLEAKKSVAATLGPEWAVPTLWHGSDLPNAVPFDVPAVLKSRHGCNQTDVLTSLPSDAEWQRLRQRSRGWQRAAYGTWLDEWAYRAVPRGLLAEPLLGGRLPLPIDYKIYVFGGTVTHIQVHLDRGGRHRWILHDRRWQPLVPGFDTPSPPASLSAMIEAAETLARDQDFLRVDFYDIDGRPYFGEFCLYPGSGLDPFAADWIDLELGALWLAAAAAREGLVPPF